MNEHDTDRLELLDRIAMRVLELDLDQNEVEWTTLDDRHEALLVNGGGFDGGPGAFVANAGNDLHVIGTLDSIVPTTSAASWSRPDKARVVARAVP
jgi:hypothetical protein